MHCWGGGASPFRGASQERLIKVNLFYNGLVTKVNLFYNGDIWDIAPLAEDNYSGLSPNIPGGLADRCIALGKGTVLDPFAGEGSIPLAAMRAGRDWLACDMRTDLMRVFEERRLKAGWQI